MRKQSIAYLFLIAIFLTAFYIRALPLFAHGYSVARFDGIKYTYLAASINHEVPKDPFFQKLEDFPPSFFYLSAFLSKFFGEINTSFILAAFLTSTVTIGTFFFVRMITKSAFYALASSLLAGIGAEINVFYSEGWLYGIASALMPLFVFLIYKLLNKEDLKYWILAGAILGIHFLTHSVLTVTALLPIIFLFFMLTERKKAIKKLSITIAIFLVVSSAYLPGLIFGYHFTQAPQIYRAENVESTGIYNIVENILLYLPSWFLVLVGALFPLAFLKIKQDEIKFSFHKDKTFLLFLIWFLVYAINFGLRFLNINEYWSYRFMFLYPQFVAISLPVLFSRIGSHVSKYAFVIVATSIIMLSYPIWIAVAQLEPTIINDQKAAALEWFDGNTEKNSTILFINNNPDYGGFGWYKDFTWRISDEIGLQDIQLAFVNKSSLNRNYTFFVIVNSSRNIIQLTDGTVLQATDILVENSKKIGYGRTVYRNDGVIVLSEHDVYA